MAKFKRMKDRKIVMTGGRGPFPYHKNWLGKRVPKWHDFEAGVMNLNDAKNRVTRQTWAYTYYSSGGGNFVPDALYFTVNKKGYVPDGAMLVYEKGADTYVLESILKKCTSGPLYGASMVITCNNTDKFFSEEKINRARKDYAELKKSKEDIMKFSLGLDEKIKTAYSNRTDIREKLKKLNKKLNDDLAAYNKNYENLYQEKGDKITLKAMEEDIKLRDSSDKGYYYIWLTLAISGLATVAIMTRK